VAEGRSAGFRPAPGGQTVRLGQERPPRRGVPCRAGARAGFRRDRRGAGRSFAALVQAGRRPGAVHAQRPAVSCDRRGDAIESPPGRSVAEGARRLASCGRRGCGAMGRPMAGESARGSSAGGAVVRRGDRAGPCLGSGRPAPAAARPEFGRRAPRAWNDSARTRLTCSRGRGGDRGLDFVRSRHGAAPCGVGRAGAEGRLRGRGGSPPGAFAQGSGRGSGAGRGPAGRLRGLQPAEVAGRGGARRSPAEGGAHGRRAAHPAGNGAGAPQGDCQLARRPPAVSGALNGGGRWSDPEGEGGSPVAVGAGGGPAGRPVGIADSAGRREARRVASSAGPGRCGDQRAVPARRGETGAGGAAG
jgi:hypothetical protein